MYTIRSQASSNYQILSHNPSIETWSKFAIKPNYRYLFSLRSDFLTNQIHPAAGDVPMELKEVYLTFLFSRSIENVRFF